MINRKIGKENLGNRMIEEAIAQFTFTVDDPELDEEERQDIATGLLRQLRKLDEVESVDRAKDPHPEEGHRGGENLIGVLTAKVSLDNIKKFFGKLRDRLDDKITITIQLEKDKKVEFNGKSHQLPEAEKFVSKVLDKL